MSQTRVRQVAVLLTIAWMCFAGVGAAQTQTPPPAKIDVTGVWLFEVQTDAGTGNPHLTFKQEGEKLTGHYSSPMLGEADLVGTVKGTIIEFSLTTEVQGTSFTLSFSGTIEDAKSMKGKVTLGEFGSGTFTGKRK